MSLPERRGFLSEDTGSVWEYLHHLTLINEGMAGRVQCLREALRNLLRGTVDFSRKWEGGCESERDMLAAEDSAKNKIYNAVGMLSRDDVKSAGLRDFNERNPERTASDYDLLQHILAGGGGRVEYIKEIFFLRILLELLIQDISPVIDLDWDLLDPQLREKIRKNEFHGKKTGEALNEAWRFYCREILLDEDFADGGIDSSGGFDEELACLFRKISYGAGERMATPYLVLWGFYD